MTQLPSSPLLPSLLSKAVSEVLRYKKKVNLGEREIQFLSMIGDGDNSSYKIFARLKKAGMPIDYTNINKRVKRLHQLGLITKAKGQSIHNAKFYTLTSEGLFYLMSGGMLHLEKAWLDKHEYNKVLKCLLEPYFEENTILAYSSQYDLIKYLQECCQMILSSIEAVQLSRHLRAQDKDNVRKDSMTPEQEEALIYSLLKKDLEWQARTLAFKLVCKEDLSYTPSYEPGSRGMIFFPRDKTILAKDRKFMNFFKNLGKWYEQELYKLVQSVSVRQDQSQSDRVNKARELQS